MKIQIKLTFKLDEQVFTQYIRKNCTLNKTIYTLVR